MPGLAALIAALVIAALVGALIGYFGGVKSGRAEEKAAPRTACDDYDLVSSSATHGDYRPVNGGQTYSIRRDELAAHLELSATAPWPRRIHVCITLDGGKVTTTIT